MMQNNKETLRQTLIPSDFAENTKIFNSGRIMWKSLRPYALGLLLTVSVVALKAFYPRLGLQPFLLASLPFIIVVLLGNWRAAAFTLVLTTTLIFYLYLPPTYSFESIQDNLTEISVFIVQGVIIIWLVHRLQETTLRLHAAKDHLEEQVKLRTRKLDRIAKNLRQHRARLQEINRSKDELIAISSHELRTPATGVKQYLGMVLEGYVGKVTKQQFNMLSTAFEQNEKQLKVVDSILKIASLDGGKVSVHKTSVDIGKLLSEVINSHRSKADAKHQKIVYVPPKQTFVWVDADYMGEAFGNIIENAINFTHEKKSIYIEVQSRKSTVAISIKDEGVGIAKSDLHKIFEKFSRIENPLSVVAGGTGLRLYWTKKIIGMNGGKIRVRSDIGMGTTFTIILPVREPNK